MRLDALFEVKNGIASTGLTIFPAPVADSVPYLRPASTQRRTIAGWIMRAEVEANHIHPAETLFVSTNGEGSHSYAYVSSFAFVGNSDVCVLLPRQAMSLQEKIFYARCISLNRYRFSYGRKPKGERLKRVELPAYAPEWIKREQLCAEAWPSLQRLLRTEHPATQP
ncbi:MAG: restriction endonuclease, partial [Aeromonas sp.]